MGRFVRRDKQKRWDDVPRIGRLKATSVEPAEGRLAVVWTEGMISSVSVAAREGAGVSALHEDL
jgi:hypothetical protein